MSVRCVIGFPRDDAPRLRHSFQNPRTTLTAWHLDDVVPLLREAERHARKGRWAVGMVAYEAAPAFDPAFLTHAPLNGIPLAAFAVFDDPSAWEDAPRQDFRCSVWRSEMPRAGFLGKVEHIRAAIAEGAYYQVNLTTRLEARFEGDSGALFNSLCAAQPGSFSLYLDFGDWQIASVSPELFFAWDPATDALATRPMKGTAPLEKSAADLRASAKDCAENLMIVDLLRNDISRVARQGSVHVPKLFTVEDYATVRQMTSTVAAVTAPQTDLAKIFAALFPCGSITGAPKIAAMRAIAALEDSPRGPYCGALGVLQPGGAALFSVGIRTVTIIGGEAECGIGSGITADSSGAAEHEECEIKRRFLLRATASFDLLESIKLEDGAFWLLGRHCKRLERAARHFGFPFDTGTINCALDAVRRAHPAGVHAVRLLLSRQGAVKTEMTPMPITPPFPRVVLAETPVSSDNEFLRYKTTHRAVYEAFASKSPDIFDTLLFNERGEVTEFTRGNVAVELDGQCITPPETSGLLPGTLRAELLAQGKLIETAVTREDVPRAAKIWFLNSLRGMLAVRQSRES